jgi:GNAT superfamily N-acetyltransferase
MRMSSIEAVGATEIRRLVPGDWSALRQVRLAALADAPYAFSSTLEREEGFDERQWRQRIDSSAHFMAWQDGEPAGLAGGFRDVDLAAACHLVAMWVSPQARGHGVADGLVEAVCAWGRENGAARAVLWVTEVNARAQAFYRRLGFVSNGTRQLVRPQEPDHWEVQMERQLG